MQPIATYHETRLEGRRHFALYPDRIVVSCRSAARDYDIPLMLRDLSSPPRRVRIRPKFYPLGLVLAFLPWCVALPIAATRSGGDVMGVFVFPIAFTIVGGVIALASARKVEFASFAGRMGATAVLDMARAGPEAHQFDSFVAAVEHRIAAVQGDSISGEPPHKAMDWADE